VDDHWVIVATLTTQLQADAARLPLEADGIPTLIDWRRITARLAAWDLKVPASRAEEARGVLAALERARAVGDERPVDVVCEECGQASTFPPAQRGTVQHCPHCSAYLDVGPPA
jgi:hypothetical protein